MCFPIDRNAILGFRKNIPQHLKGFLGNLDITIIKNSSDWFCVVDDMTFAVSENEIVVLLQHLNSIEPSIQFTVERETDGKLETVVYRKP